MIYCQTNYEHGTRAEVTGPLNGMFYVVFKDVDCGKIIGTRNYCASAEREAVAYAVKLVAGEVQPGDFVTL
jgi:hypothetical protein